MDTDILEEVWQTILERRKNPRPGSYTNKLLGNREMITRKLREELEEIIEAMEKGNVRNGKDSLVWEVSDLLYHLLVLLADTGVDLKEVMGELRSRHSATPSS